MANNRFMSNLSNSDTSLWLHNKLGTSNDLWSDTTSIVSQLSGDVLHNIRDCFVDLQSQVKLKLLLSFLHISRRNVEQWKTELEEIIEVAVEDSDQWVSMLAELLKNYPNNGTINFQLDTNSGSFNDLVVELKKLVKSNGHKSILPLECLYLNKNALTANVGQMPQPIKYFALKRKPKSAILRAELLQKSNDAATGRRNSTGPSIPIRCRGLTNDSTPLKGIPSRSTFGSSLTSGFKAPPNPVNKIGPNLNNTRSRLSVGGVKRDGGIKLLDITEQPLGRDSKRRKKVQNEENDTKQKEVEKAEPEAATPDYAAGLTSTVPPSPAPMSYAPPATPAPQPTVVQSETYSQIQPIISTAMPAPLPAQPPMTPTNVVQQRFVVNENYVNPSADNSGLKVETKVIKTVNAMVSPVLQMAPTPQLVQQLQATPTPVQVIPAQVAQQQTPQPQQPFVRRQLQLSREQMLAAQEMFNNSNKVTRPEKALILGFMAGSRENPCPQLGNVVTIKLSENEEDVRQSDSSVQRMVVETHFQMNYNTGDWKKVQKIRKLDQNMQNTHTIQGYQTLQQTV